MKKPTFDYNKETGKMICQIYYKNQIFTGIAQCHPDEKYKSEFTGGEIAERRAQIKQLQYIKNCEIAPQIQAYKHLISTMLKNKQFNPQSYEFKRIKAEYDNLIAQMNKIKHKIAYKKDFLKEYLKNKDEVNKWINPKHMQDKLKMLGISPFDANGKMKTTLEVMTELANKWEQMDNSK